MFTGQTQSISGDEAAGLALAALGWTLEEPKRAGRLLALTGLDPDGLKAGLDDPAVQVAVLDFLCDHEPDLVKCAEALAITPEDLVAARVVLRGGGAA